MPKYLTTKELAEKTGLGSRQAVWTRAKRLGVRPARPGTNHQQALWPARLAAEWGRREKSK